MPRLPAALRKQLEENDDVVVLLDPAKVGQILEAAGATDVVVRPDRYILGLGDTPEALERLVAQHPESRPRRAGPHLDPHPRPTDRTQETIMAFSPITHLRHFDIAVPDYQKQVEFYKNHWGLTEMENDGGVTYFAAEGSPEQYSVRVRKADEKRLDMVAFGAADKAPVDQLASDLIAKGVKLLGEPDDVKTLGGGYGFRFFDLEGRTIEVSSDVEVRKHRKIEEREAIPVKLSHVVLNSPEPEKMRAWYEQHLGFRLSDTLNHPHMGDLFYFMRCNAQHHSIAIARGPHASLQHASFELRGIDEYMRGSGRLLRSGFKKIWGPGRHSAGDNTFTYFHDPNGNTMEYTTELDTVDEDTWHPSIYDTSEPETSDQWGTGGDMDEFIAREMFNDQDKGLYVAPPV